MSNPTRERPPARGAASEDHQGAGSGHSLPATTDAVTDDTIPTLAELGPRGRAIASEYYASGFAAGLNEGWDRRERSYAERHEVVRAIVRRLAATPSYSLAADLRGQPERAEAQRATLRRNGVSG